MWIAVIASTDSSASSGTWLPTIRRTTRPSATIRPRAPMVSHFAGVRSAIALRVDGGQPAKLIGSQAGREVVIENEARQERSIVGDATGGARLLEDRSIRVVLEEDPTWFVRRGRHRLKARKADISTIFADRKLLVTQILQRPGEPVVSPHRSRLVRLERADGTWHVDGGPGVEEGEDVAIRDRVRSGDGCHRNPDGRGGRERPAAAPRHRDRQGDDDDQRNGRRHQVAWVAGGAIEGSDDHREQRERQEQQNEVNRR